jgi:hypothetical protein
MGRARQPRGRGRSPRRRTAVGVTVTLRRQNCRSAPWVSTPNAHTEHHPLGVTRHQIGNPCPYGSSISPAGRPAAHTLLRMSASATDVSVDPLSFEGSPCKRLGVQAFLRLNFDRRRNVGAAKSYNRLSIVGYWNRLPVPY